MIKKKINEEALVAEFCGFKWRPNEYGGYYLVPDCFYKLTKGGIIYPSQLKFKNDWNWLMIAVEKIEHLYETKTSLPRFEINSHHCEFAVAHPLKYKSWIVGCYPESPESIKANSKIEAAHMVVVEFIKWYNKNK